VERLGLGVADNATQVQALATLRLVVNDKLDELLGTIELKKASKSEEALSAVASNKGKALMDRARDVLARMFAEEQRLLAFREISAEQTYKWAVGGIAAAILITLALGWLTLVDAKRQFEIANNAENVARAAHQRTLDEVARRERLEGQLRQSQKMEAMGQLTGGIAHDFNNMLAVVIGSLNLLKRRLHRGETDNNMRFIDGALDGAERAATLTHRLLAFSRQQPLTPQAVEPNKLISGMSEMLRRTLGEHIAVETVLAGGLWRTHADPSQLESAILNLAVNSRDAMPNGGRLTIETANASLDEAYAAQHLDVPVGQYVLLAISDTGQGMPADVIAKAFEPFFTTKGVGKGTGLGLSQVLGFVKQSGGPVKIYSEPDHGTTISSPHRSHPKRGHIGGRASPPITCRMSSSASIAPISRAPIRTRHQPIPASARAADWASASPAGSPRRTMATSPSNPMSARGPSALSCFRLPLATKVAPQWPRCAPPRSPRRRTAQMLPQRYIQWRTVW